MESERIITKIQTTLIYIRAGILSIINIGSKLKYTSQPTFNDPLDIPSIGYINSVVGAAPTKITFLSSDTFPFIISTTTLGAYFNFPPTLVVRELLSAGIYRDRTDIQPVYDSGANTVTLDIVAMDGDITFKV